MWLHHWSGFCPTSLCVCVCVFLIWVFVPVGFWWVVGNGGVIGMVEAWWWWLGCLFFFYNGFGGYLLGFFSFFLNLDFLFRWDFGGQWAMVAWWAWWCWFGLFGCWERRVIDNLFIILLYNLYYFNVLYCKIKIGMLRVL